MPFLDLEANPEALGESSANCCKIAYHSKSPYSDFPAFAAVCIAGAILGYCKSGGSKEIALEEYSSWRSRLGRQQSSSLKSPDAVQDDPMRWNNSTDGAACFLRLAGPQVM
jgi:hypothetical protein